ncbi:MAG: hypothetical protein FJ134_11355 [Deltaproteobacteria bacterium]|nr:hypothetical protein [Deltaproteobacteria bacterium]
MDEKVIKLKDAAKALVNYIDTENVFDKMADCGCGGWDTYRSDKFDAVVQALKDALRDLGVEAGAVSRSPSGIPAGGSCKIQ